jgi:S1-C subfamily serine protease
LVGLGLAALGLGCSSGMGQKAQSAKEAKVADYSRGLTCRVRGQFSKDLRYGFLRWAIHDEVPEDVREGLIVYGAAVSMGGSGYPVWTDGKRSWVATNAHVLDGIDEDVVLTFDAGETNLSGKTVYIDPRYDIGFIEVKKRLPIVRFASGFHENMPVFAAGYPSDLYQITPGKISNRCFQFSKLSSSSFRRLLGSAHGGDRSRLKRRSALQRSRPVRGGHEHVLLSQAE